jgi:hypothetical protein
MSIAPSEASRLFRYRSITLLRCALFGVSCLLAQTLAHAEAPMSFEAVQIGSGRAVIAATGQITEDTPSAFLSFLEQSNETRQPVVFLDSPGGRVLASMEFGALLRKVGAQAIVARVASDGQGGSIVVQAQCFSACVYAFMGASTRIVPRASQIGIHRMFAYQDEFDASGTAVVRRRRYDNGDMRSFLMRYSSAMGISPTLIVAAEHIPSDTLRILSPAEIRRYHLGTARR